MEVVGARVWELLENKITIGEIVSVICEEYEVDEKTCTTDILSFINEMMESDLIVPA